MIELKENDLVKVVGKDNKVRLTTVERVEPNTDCPYITHDIFFNNNYESQGKRFEIIAVWRYNEETGNYLKIYDKDMPYINDPKFRNKPCELVEPDKVEYDKYVSLQSENAELRNIIVELNKKLYGE